MSSAVVAKRHFFFALALALADLCWSAGALSADLLTLYRAAAGDNPSLKIRALSAERTEAEARVAESRLHPQISLQSSYSHNDYQAGTSGVNYSGQRTIVMLRQPLIDIASTLERGWVAMPHRLRGQSPRPRSSPVSCTRPPFAA